ncbi:hypothetical protein GGG16DRAFT_129586 [Schizophyllum commune]
MSNTPSPSSSASPPLIPSKRKWTSKTMKTWVATDPSSTEPDVHHGDKRAAARAAKIKKQKTERDAANRAPPTYRLIFPPPGRNTLNVPPTIELSSLISFDEDYKREESHSNTLPHKIAPASTTIQARPECDPSRAGIPNGETAFDSSKTSENIGMQGGGRLTFRRTTVPALGGADPDGDQPRERRTATVISSDAASVTTAQGVSVDESIEACRGTTTQTEAAVQTVELEDQSGQSDANEAKSGNLQNNVPIVANTEYAADNSGFQPKRTSQKRHLLAQVTARKGTTMASAAMRTRMVRDEDFNEGWKRFGPQGRDISEYAPRFPDTPTVQWPSGLITTTPFLPDVRRGKRGRNMLKWDQNYVETVARKFKSSRDRPDLCVHAEFTTLKAAFELIDECNANGKPLVFDNFPDSIKWAHAANGVDDDPYMDPMSWSADRIRGIVGANLDTPRDFQDAWLREVKPLHPYVTATLREFHTWLKMPGKVRCILDLTCGFRQSDDVTDKMADNVVESFSSTFGNMYAGHFHITADMIKTLDWFLLHTSGFLTFGHIDASGMATSAEIRGAGLKEWIVFSATNMPKPKSGDSRQDRRRLQSRLVQRIRNLIAAASRDDLSPPKRQSGETDWDVDGCIIELRPGMKYYQPAGTVHAAYTPVPTAAAGKHFFTYNDLHRMEVSRRVQRTKKSVTNHDHTCGVQLMLITMAAALPIRATTGQVFFRKPMIAMALMLTRPHEYIEEPDPLLDNNSEGEVNPHKGQGRDEEKTEKERAEAKGVQAAIAERVAEYDMTQRLRDKHWADNGTAFDRLAYTVAMRILLACKSKYAGDKRAKIPGCEYIFEGDRWDDPGPPLDIRGLTDDLRTTHVDEVISQSGGSEEGEDSDSDLSD